MLTSSTQRQNRSFHVVERTRTSSKCQKMKYARAKILSQIVKYANLWGFCCRRRRGCLSSLKIDCRNAKLHFQMTFSLPSPSCLLKLPNVPSPYLKVGNIVDVPPPNTWFDLRILNQMKRPSSSLSLFPVFEDIVVYCTGKSTSRTLALKEVFCRHPEMLSEIVVFGSWQPC